MSIRLTRPSPAALQALMEAGRSDSLTYSPVGISQRAETVPGYHLDHWSLDLGATDEIFRRASDAIRTWQIHRGAGLIVCTDGPPAVGNVVAMAARMPVGYIDVVCRVVEVVDRTDRFGFVYGTLSVHPEAGEESFTVVRDPDGRVVFEIAAASRPRHVLARACPPVARRLQRAATTRYLEAMTAAVAG